MSSWFKFAKAAQLRGWIVIICALALTAGASSGSAGALDPASHSAKVDPNLYKIGLFDKLSINVFGVKELDLDSVQVDSAGQIQLPLIGGLRARDKTCLELSDEIAAILNQHYLRDAQVSVIVASSANQNVTVEGAVIAAGVFEIPGRMTLLQALALAKGPTNRADMKHVAIFREVDGKRSRLTFDLIAIQSGHNDDPEMSGNDVVVVSESTPLAAFREVIGDVGAFSIFSIFR
jgi:polysaccharide export outer membrane protein